MPVIGFYSAVHLSVPLPLQTYPIRLTFSLPTRNNKKKIKNKPHGALRETPLWSRVDGEAHAYSNNSAADRAHKLALERGRNKEAVMLE